MTIGQRKDHRKKELKEERIKRIINECFSPIQDEIKERAIKEILALDFDAPRGCFANCYVCKHCKSSNGRSYCELHEEYGSIHCDHREPHYHAYCGDYDYDISLNDNFKHKGD